MNKDIKYILLLILLAYFFFFYGNGLISLTSPDEVFYAQTAKEMAAHHSWMTPILFDEPQFEKPILLYWLLRIAYLMFGVTSFSARFFPACFALFGIITVYLFTRLLFREEKKSFVSALVLLSSCLYIGLARTVFTDMVFSVMILLSLFSFYWGYIDERYKGAGIILFFIFSALAVLAKGPLGLVIPLSVVAAYLLFSRNIRFILCKDTFWGLIIFLAIALPWYIFMVVKFNQSFIHEFFYNDHYRRLIEAEHAGNDTWFFYPLTMMGCMFPWSIFVIVALFFTVRHIRRINTGNLFLASWIIVTFIIFQFAHSKLTSYIFPMFPALAIVCGNFIYDSIKEKERQRQFLIISEIMWFIALFVFMGSIVASLKFSYYFSSMRPVYFMISIFGIWLVITAFSILRKRSFTVFNLFVLLMPIFMVVIPFIHRDIEPYFSSKYASEYLLKNYSLESGPYLLCSKVFVRGVRFYTDMPVVAYGGNFFSSHPIPFLNSDAEIKGFLHQQRITYGFFKKSSLEDLKRVTRQEFDLQVIKNIGNQYIVKIQQK